MLIFSILLMFSVLLCRPRIAYNGMAAWRQRRLFATYFNSALPAAVAPNRSLAAGLFISASLFLLEFLE